MGDGEQPCKACGAIMPAGIVFCEQCGAEQGKVAVGGSVQPRPPVVSFTGDRPLEDEPAVSLDAMHSDDVAATHPPTVGERVAVGARPARVTIRQRSGSEAPSIIGGRRESRCPDLEVLYKAARVFVEGLVMPFEFRLIPKRDGIEDVFIEIRGNRRVVARSELAEELDSGFEVPVALPFTPGADMVGKVPFEIWIGYTVDEKSLHFIARKAHTCFRRTEPMNKVMEQLKIELHNDVQAGNASDPVVNMSIDGLDRFLPTANGPAEDFRHIDIPDIWERVFLVPGRYRPLGATIRGPGVRRPPPAEALVEGLTLVTSAGDIHLIDRPQIALGRDRRRCQVVCRLPWPGEPRDPANPNLMISGRHGTLELTDGHWTLRDGGWEDAQGKWRRSTHGMYLNGCPVSHAEACNLPEDVPFLLALVRADSGDMRTFRLDGMVWSSVAVAMRLPGCGGENRKVPGPAAVVLHCRLGGAGTYVLLCGTIGLNMINPALPEGCICRSDGAFLLRGSNGCEWLVPGGRHRCGGVDVEVREYQPNKERKQRV